jgi:superfamily I DNA and/or RNA helicase
VKNHKNILEYYLITELLNINQEKFKVNYFRNSKIISPKKFKEVINGCRAPINNKQSVNESSLIAYKINVGVISIKGLTKYLQDIGFFENSEEIDNIKDENQYISLGYFYITKQGHLIISNDKCAKVMPIVYLLQLFKDKKNTSDSIKEFVDKAEEMENFFNKAFFTENWIVDISEPSLSYILDSSAILEPTFDANKLENLKNCAVYVTTPVLSELDILKKLKEKDKDKSNRANSFVKKICDMTEKIKMNLTQEEKLILGVWYPPSDKKEEKRIFLKSIEYSDSELDINKYGVDSKADVSVVKAAVELSSKSFPFVVTKDRRIVESISMRTTCFWHSVDFNTDLALSSRKISNIKSANNFDELKKLEEFLFDVYFNNLSDLLEEARKKDTKISDYYFNGTSISIEETTYKKAIEDLNEVSANQTVEDLSKLINLDEESNLLDIYLSGREIKTNLNSVKNTIETFISQDIPLAKWLSPYNPFLTQQIAINYANILQRQDLMAVNGPPGTGKTTLLKDIIANIIVKRAVAIINSDYQIFDEKGILADFLKGYGVVVASNNNAAVENISIELPKLNADVEIALKSIGEEEFEYFEEFINKYFTGNQSETDYGDEDEDDIDTLDKAKKYKYLGLLSLPLGNYKNRSNATNIINEIKNFLINKNINVSQKDIENIGKKILQFKKEIEEYSKKHKLYYDYIKEQLRMQIKIDNLELEYQSFKKEIEEQESKIEKCILQIQDNENKMAKTKELLEMYINAKPSILKEFSSFFSKAAKKDVMQWRSKYDSFLQDIENTDKEISRLKDIQKSLETLRKELISNYEKTKNEIDSQNSEKEQKENLAKHIYENIGNILIKKDLFFKIILEPESLTTEEKEYIYRFNAYQNEKLNILRMQIFVESLKLHMSLILKYKIEFADMLHLIVGLLPNPSAFKNFKYTVDKLFDAFFFIVPVTSTTFASFGNLFRQASMSYIGYLMIDEAGQAVPYSAAMPLYKSQRAVVVGDPFQIEPVVTIANNVNKILINSHKISSKYDLTASSVQTLSDESSEIGAIYGSNRLGIPLNVHRRCNNPMFEIANIIAYDNRMIKGADNKYSIDDILPEYCNKHSLWIHVDFDGSKNDDGVVKDEINALRRLIYDMELKIKDKDKDKDKDININNFVREKNIFIITPFKAVESHLYKNLDKKILEQALSNKSLGRYIGTIHTFQGKESKIVIIVLGGKNEKSMSWVAQKPNMLNVALTRAKEYCFIIGDRNKWGKQNYFRYALSNLPVIDKTIIPFKHS